MDERTAKILAETFDKLFPGTRSAIDAATPKFSDESMGSIRVASWERNHVASLFRGISDIAEQALVAINRGGDPDYARDAASKIENLANTLDSFLIDNPKLGGE